MLRTSTGPDTYDPCSMAPRLRQNVDYLKEIYREFRIAEADGACTFSSAIFGFPTAQNRPSVLRVADVL